MRLIPLLAVTVLCTQLAATDPLVIDSPGRVQLEAPLDAGTSIHIRSSYVTLDLGGHVLEGTGAEGHAITIDADASAVLIQGGKIHSWSGYAIYAPDAAMIRLEDLVIRNCDGGGIVLGNFGTVTATLVQGTRGDGIRLGDASFSEETQSLQNAGAGIVAGGRSSIQDSQSISNGTFGIQVGPGSVISDSQGSNNGTDGILAGRGSTVSNTVAVSNQRDGIRVQYSSVVTSCVAEMNMRHGIVAGDGSVVTGSTANDSGDVGLFASEGSRVSDVALRSNQGTAIHLQRGSLLSGATISNSMLGLMIPQGYVQLLNVVADGNQQSMRALGPVDILSSTMTAE